MTKLDGQAFHTLALALDGTVWSWGDNELGQLGDGSLAGRDVPAQVPGMSNVVDIAVGGEFSLALTRDGQVWAWGGNLTAVVNCNPPWVDPYRTVPVPVTGLSDVTAIDAGGGLAVALKSDGSVWTWGTDNFGQLGDGGPIPSANRCTPQQVVGPTDVRSIATSGGHVLALTGAGTVWAWGWNVEGQLGDGSLNNRSVPQAVAGIGAVTAIAAGGHHSLALLADGSVMGWGFAGIGQLGYADPIDELTPTPIRGLGGWRVLALAGGGLSSYALAERLPNAVPGAPTDVVAYGAGPGSVDMYWTQPISDGGSPITGWTVTASPGGAVTTVAALPFNPFVSLTFAGLSGGTTYTFTVTATNAVGTGPPSDPSGPILTLPATQSITFANPGGNKTMLDSPLAVSATSTSGLVVSFTTTSTPGVCSAGGLNGASITFLSTGLCTIVAAQAGDANWAAATSVSRNVNVSKATQSITFANPGGNKTMIQSPLAVSATSTSGLVVSFTTTSTPGCAAPAGLNGASITFLSTGLCTIVAAQAVTPAGLPRRQGHATSRSRRRRRASLSPTPAAARPCSIRRSRSAPRPPRAWWCRSPPLALRGCAAPAA